MKRKKAENEEGAQSSGGGNTGVPMQYLTPEKRVALSGPMPFPPTPGKQAQLTIAVAMKFAGKCEEEIQRVIAEVNEREAQKPMRTRADVVREVERNGVVIPEADAPQSMRAFMMNYVIPSIDTTGNRVARAANSVAQIGMVGLNRQTQSTFQNVRDIRTQMEKTTAAQSAVESVVSGAPGAPSRGTELYVRWITELLARSDTVNRQVIGAAHETLLGNVCPESNISNRTQVVEIQETPVTRSYLDEFLRAPIPHHPYETECVFGEMCFGYHISHATCRSFYPPESWEEIKKQGTRPQYPNMCIICTIWMVNELNMRCRVHHVIDPRMQLTYFQFAIGTSANEFTHNMCIPDLGRYGVHAPFLSNMALRFTFAKKEVMFQGNTFHLPGWSVANFRCTSATSPTESDSTVSEWQLPLLCSASPERTSSAPHRSTLSSSTCKKSSCRGPQSSESN